MDDEIENVSHRRHLKSAVRALVESAAPAAAAPAPMAAEDANDEAIAVAYEVIAIATIDAAAAALELKLHVNGPGGSLCSITLDPSSKMKDLKAAIADSSG